MAELMMDGVVGSRDAIRREVQRQYAVSQNTSMCALIRSADDLLNGRTESITPGEVKLYAGSVPDAAKGYFIDGPTQVTQEAFELVDDVLTRGPTAMSRDLGTMVGTLWSSPDARDQAFTAFERSFQECLDNPEKGGAASFKLTLSVLGGEEVAARSMVEWTKRAGSAGRLLGHLDDVNLGDASRLGTMTDTVSAPRSVAGAADDLVIDSYGVLRRRSDIPGQAHHLNQDAAFRSRIAHSDGVSVKLEGDAFTDVGTPHYNAHESMESFWDIYRRGGMDAGNLPTNNQYNRALYNGLQESGLSPAEALRAVQAAKAQQLRAGLRGSDLVPRLPGRINQVPRGN
jgi:hypothetical protein